MQAEGQDSSQAAADVGVEQHGVKYDDFSEQIFGSSFSLGDDESWQSEQNPEWQSTPDPEWQSVEEPEWQSGEDPEWQQHTQRYDEHDARTQEQDNWRTK